MCLRKCGWNADQYKENGNKFFHIECAANI